MIEEEEKEKAKEPEASYGKRNIQIFHSFEEMEQYDIIQTLKIEPIQRIRDTVGLILRMYGLSREDLNKRKPENKIEIRYFE